MSSDVGVYNFICQRNEDFRKEVIWKDENSIPMDVSEMQVLFQVRPYENGPVILEMNSNTPETNVGHIEIGGTDGKFVLTLSKEVTKDLRPNEYLYDMFVFDSLTHARKLLAGFFTVTGSITLGTPDSPG